MPVRTAPVIETGYEDFRGEWQEVAPETLEAVAALLGPETDDGDVRVVTAGEAAMVRGEVELEDGASLVVDGTLPPDMPLGYHRCEGAPLIVVPSRCRLPADLRTWGWAVQLYALHSSESWAMGDLGDLRRFNRWAAAQGAGVVLVNPLHASLPTVQQPSPYSPSSRCFRNPIYLRVEGEGFAPGEVIDRDDVWARKRAALEARFDGGDEPGFERFCEEGGEGLRRYAAFCALAEQHGGPWPEWPADVRRPDGPGVGRVPEERVRFHQWLQWLVDEQLAAAGAELPVMQDMAVGCDPAGADCWLWQDAFCLEATVGAPPDEFNTEGQDWSLPPFHPGRLRAAAYEPFVHTVRAMFRHAGAVRVDHVMGLFRLWWVPAGADPSQGAYVRYPWRDLLGILALESVRAGAYVVGEDLGTVAPWMREELSKRDVLAYRLVWFGDEFPEKALAAVTTHDLPTIAGVWSGQDEPGLRRRLPAASSLEEAITRTYERLAATPSMAAVATLEDVLGVAERPNRPGTTDARNWSVPLPKPLEEIERDPLVAEVARVLRSSRP